MNKKLVFLAVVTLLANRIALGDGVAPAVPVMCGDTIFVDTDLSNNLIDCPGDGITIGADKITLALKGLIIDGRDDPLIK